jgi:Raf kinase inhibitor-like YbhB/YbcL family protein
MNYVSVKKRLMKTGAMSLYFKYTCMETTIRFKTKLNISSPSFKQEGLIPRTYTCEGSNVNPPLVIESIPEETLSLALIMDDPDAPGGTFDHWVVWNIPPVKSIPENSNPGLEGMNSMGELGYTGPCPPSGTHRYFFKVYAVDVLLDTQKGATKEKVEFALQDHTIAYGELIGLYKKKN